MVKFNLTALSLLLTTFYTASVEANEVVKIRINEALQANIESKGPQTYLYQDGELRDYIWKTNLTIAKKLNVDVIESNVTKEVGDPIQFSKQETVGKHVVLVTLDQDVGKCPPCREQEEYLYRVLDHFKDVKYTEIRIIQ